MQKYRSLFIVANGLTIAFALLSFAVSFVLDDSSINSGPLFGLMSVFSAIAIWVVTHTVTVAFSDRSFGTKEFLSKLQGKVIGNVFFAWWLSLMGVAITKSTRAITSVAGIFIIAAAVTYMMQVIMGADDSWVSNDQDETTSHERR